jgi:hypothetical protein
MRIGIVLSGWAPAMTLMSGVMRGFIEKGVTFDVVSTSGIGGLIGLLSLAPKDKKLGEVTAPDDALRELPNLFVSDLLHMFVPLNFKMFYKYGPFAQPAYEFRKRLRRIPVDPASARPGARLVNDWMDLVATALTPTTLETYRNGLMSQVSMIEDLVDFTKLRAANTRFYLNAFDLAGKAQRIFDNQTVGADVHRAAQAMFLLFPPERVGGRLHTTGATHDPTGLQAIWLKERKNLDVVIALDPVSRAIWRAPRNIHDAFQLMLLNPVVALQALMLALYAAKEFVVNLPPPAPPMLPRLYRIPFDTGRCTIPPAYYPEMLEWTHDNAVTLESVGRCAAREFADVLILQGPDALDASYRYARKLDDRSAHFLRIFRDLGLFGDNHVGSPHRSEPHRPPDARKSDDRRPPSGRTRR